MAFDHLKIRENHDSTSALGMKMDGRFCGERGGGFQAEEIMYEIGS